MDEKDGNRRKIIEGVCVIKRKVQENHKFHLEGLSKYLFLLICDHFWRICVYWEVLSEIFSHWGIMIK